MTPRMKRGLEISAREAELVKALADFDRQRTRLFQETGVRQSGEESAVSPEERAVRAELRQLTAERAAVLKEIADEQARLQAKQSAFDRVRAKEKAAGRRKAPASRAEEKVRARLAALQRERAYVDGTVHRDRELGRLQEAIWWSSHDPETFDSGDW
ncbi:hypothetical protein [Actinoallomurus iriomotensis]|uniref:Uncharacterized protein n=1 Tax=Actinoallomurus iriomotensis TaxID=478107 RepID=A0A9W6S2T3_9ACTN|nr:hypothetical protein [Actinoallomurus iriomotensis]GLY86039.1 hypothetical protein Airi02_039680 [Actinoallomurus iriomotensis]